MIKYCYEKQKKKHIKIWQLRFSFSHSLPPHSLLLSLFNKWKCQEEGGEAFEKAYKRIFMEISPLPLLYSGIGIYVSVLSFFSPLPSPHMSARTL